MAQVAKGAGADEAAAPEPFRSATPAFEKRMTLDLTAEDDRNLKRVALDEDVPMAEVLRAPICSISMTMPCATQ